MANFELSLSDGWQDIESVDDLGITLEDGTTYTIGTDDDIRVYAKATEPQTDEGYIVERGVFMYTHKTGNKLWLKALSFPSARVTI